jgi:hypothetical protein
MLVAATAVVGLILRLAVPVSAAPVNSLARYKPAKPAALARFEAGNRAYKDARDTTRPLADRARDLRRAIDEYSAGQAIDDAAAFDYNIAHCARLLADNATAVAHLQRFLDRAAQLDAKLRDDIEREIAELDPSGSIRANLRQASAPGPSNAAPIAAVEAPPSSHTAVASQPALPIASPPGVSPPGASGPSATSTVAAPRASRAWLALGWGLTAAGVVGGGVATWLAVDAAGLDRDSKDTSRATSDRVVLEHRADSRRGAALIVGISGGAAVVLGVVTLLLPARSETRAATSAWNLRVTGNGVAVIGRF